jgi:hypothetical protein
MAELLRATVAVFDDIENEAIESRIFSAVTGQRFELYEIPLGPFLVKELKEAFAARRSFTCSST